MQTKLNIPPSRPNLVRRPQLFELLNQSIQPGTKLSLVAAPAGFGKTTLVSSWIRLFDIPAAWLSIDESDNEPNRFMYYTIAALQTVHAALGKSSLALLQSPQPPSIETLLTLLINDLAKIKRQIVLVFDDYHNIAELEIHKAITFLLDNQPPQLLLTIISRSDPMFPLHRLRGSGQMKGIYVHDLRFTNTEALSFLTKNMELDLSPEEVAIFERRTEGWVAGLQLAALSMQEMPDPKEFIEAFAGDDRYISDYLLTEVFERQPSYIQKFLLKTALLDRFSTPLCDAILGKDKKGIKVGDQEQTSQAIIERLDQSNLFIIPLDNKREWYRYHHLFADFLQYRSRQLSADDIRELHRRAAAWYEENDNLAEAITHALAGEDYDRAGRLIEQNAPTTIFGYAEWQTFVDWIEALPKDLFQSLPQLSLQYAWALFTKGLWESVDPILDSIEAAYTDEDLPRILNGEVITLRAWLAFERDNMEDCIKLADEAIELLPDDVLIIRSLAILAQGAAQFWLGQLEESQRNLQKAYEVGSAGGNKAVELVAMGCQAQAEVALGRFQKASEIYYRAREEGTIDGIALLSPVGLAIVQMGEVLREWNRIQEAKHLLAEGIRLSRQSGAPENAIEGQMILARVLLAAGEETAAEEHIAKGEAEIRAWLNRGG
ncbi:MAG: hypothetical protein R3293_28065, partial [Candidatus Promineifilaceae bacterium]|nr:hypothetical protein [Candidatus Promineifilaceae bacterium]